MNANGIFGSSLIEEQMCGNITGIMLRISVRNAYISSLLIKYPIVKKDVFIKE